MGKVGMRLIVDFQRRNMRLLRSLCLSPYQYLQGDCVSHPTETTTDSASELNRHIEVHVVMSEQEHAGGRTSYYDSYGVIRDVMQNHLTQVYSTICPYCIYLYVMTSDISFCKYTSLHICCLPTQALVYSLMNVGNMKDNSQTFGTYYFNHTYYAHDINLLYTMYIYN